MREEILREFLEFIGDFIRKPCRTASMPMLAWGRQRSESTYPGFGGSRAISLQGLTTGRRPSRIFPRQAALLIL
jgi:hypothetical protein